MSSRQQRQKAQSKEVPYLVSDNTSNRVYTKGRFLGKGGFACCYELIDNITKSVYAAKIVSKLLLGQKHQKDKMAQEVEIHRSLSHPHIVQMFHCFEDSDNVYVLLELCARRSLMELHRRRRAVTEPEARYFTHQIVLACGYLHDRRIIHRDLKLGNLFLNDDMQVKIGDFGLATRLETDGELKKTLCGTPNYISPEMFNRTGYSFEVDIWAIGCILYTLLVGKPPFETERLKDTYARIRSNQYTIPMHIGRDATALIRRLLAAQPSRRPKIHEILGTAFFTEGFLPSRLPTSCLTLMPKFNVEAVSGGGNGDDLLRIAKRALPTPRVPLAAGLSPKLPQKQDVAAVLATEKPPGEHNDYLPQLYAQLSRVLETCVKPFVEENIVEIQDPASSPIYWVAKWVDYSDKYGLGYQLCDGSIGMIFNDGTKIILDTAGEQMQYTERNNAEHYYTLNHHPPTLQKKATLLRLFRTYMNERLLQAGQNIFQNTQSRAGDELARLPFLLYWFRNTAAILFHLSNGTLQINFFHDHSKVILCPLMSAATFISADKSVATFKFSLLERFGCPNELLTRLKYAKKMIERLLAQNGTPLPTTAAAANGNRTSSWAEAKLVV